MAQDTQRMRAGSHSLRAEGDGAPAAKSVGQLVKEISEDVSTLVRKEIELAKQELGSSMAEKAKGGVAIAIAAALALFALIYITLAIRDALDIVLWRWAADLITAGILLLIGGVGAAVAARKLKKPIKADITKKTIREDVEFAKNITRSR